jgi:hypothetical protein
LNSAVRITIEVNMRWPFLPILLLASGAASATYTWVDERGRQHISTIPRQCIDSGVVAPGCDAVIPSANSRRTYEHRQQIRALTEQRDALLAERADRQKTLQRRRKALYDDDVELNDIDRARQALNDFLDADRDLDSLRHADDLVLAERNREELWAQLNTDFDALEQSIQQRAFEAARLVEMRRTEALIRAERVRPSSIVYYPLNPIHPRRPPHLRKHPNHLARPIPRNDRKHGLVFHIQ